MPSVKFAAVFAVAFSLAGAVHHQAAAGLMEDPVLASTGSVIDDTVITTKIKAAYIRDPVVGALDIHVDTYRGVVRLAGLVDSEAEREQAAAIARSIEGVREIRNDIRVK